MNLTGISFFDHDDFEFAKDDDDDLKQQKALKENSISLQILNKKIYRDEKVKGFVKIYVRNELPRGHIEMKCESLLKFSIRKKFNSLDIKDTIKNFKEELKPVEKRKSFYERIMQGFKIKKFSKEEMNKKSKVQPINRIRNAFNASSFLKRLGRGNAAVKKIQSPAGLKKTKFYKYFGNKQKSSSRINIQPKVKENNPLKLIRMKKLGGISNEEFEPPERKQSESLNMFHHPGNDIEEGDEIIEKSFLLKSQLMTLFSLREAIKFKSGLLIPFELSIPEDMPISYNQSLTVSKIIDLSVIRDYIIKNKCISKVTKNFLNKKSKMKIENKENVLIEHKLIVYYVSHEDKKEEDKDDEFNALDMFVKQVNKISSEEKFEVYDRMENEDFEKYFSRTRISAKVNKKTSKCCFIGFMNSSTFYTLNISVDRLKFRNEDSSINFVISYPNILLNVYDYVDVLLICTTSLRSSDISRRGSIKKKQNEEKEKNSKKKFQFLLSNVRKDPVKKSKEKVRKESEEDNFTNSETRHLTMKSIKELQHKEKNCINTENDEFEHKIDRIVYASSLDILGKRKLKNPEEMTEMADNDYRTELVHRINLSDIVANLQTVISENIKVEYKLIFFASIGPLSFTKKINEIPVTFISIPEAKDIVPSGEISRRFEEAHKKVPETQYGFLLPFSRIRVD